MSDAHHANAPSDSDERTLTIDLLALDLGTCGRCTRTDRNLAAAARILTDRLRAEGVTVQVRKTVVRTAEEAVRLRFESSPTIRVDGRDIALELRESPCGDCTDLCGCNEDVTCRVWVWRGREYTEAPTEMIVEGVLHAYREDGEPAAAPTGPFELPENLRRFFAARDRRSSSASSCCPPSSEGCCPPSR